MWTRVGLLALAACACAVTHDQFYPHGVGLDQQLPRGPEQASRELPLNVPIVFYGEVYESIFVNNHGVLSFRSDIPSFMNTEFPLPYPSIAAFYSNIDTTQGGTVWYRETSESHIIAKAEESVQNNFHDYYDFKPTSVFIATWVDVTYTESRQERKNSFQIAVISNGTESFVELLYPEREIQWINRETLPNGLPEAKAQAGFVAEDGRLFTLRGSGSHQIRNVVSWSNIQEPGRYVYRVGRILPDGNIAVPDQYNEVEVEIAEESKTCAQSGPSVCHTHARCVDYQAGICCQCNDGFYGNGKSCIKDDVPLRIHGKLNGVINNINLNDVDIQAYVVVADGKSYTALSQAPPNLGNSLLLLNVLGGVVGWLFAQPSGTARNGYQLTGSVFNHTASVTFPGTDDKVEISQEYMGHDVFDQIIIETYINGTVPVVPIGTKVEIAEYEEQYAIVTPGLIQSASSRMFTIKGSGQKYEQIVSQSFSYNPCRFLPSSEEDTIPMMLKVTKNYLGYEVRENIIRYAMSNRIANAGQENPCVEGRKTCGLHSTCVVSGESFDCVCQPGFTNVYVDDAVSCVDIDECVSGANNCDVNADCYNHDGGFQCVCRQGFEGNGISCRRASQCRTMNCDPNAKCVENYGEAAYCVCNAGFNGDGQRCTQVQTPENNCDNCSPNGYCAFSPYVNFYKCECKPGYLGDGITCVRDPSSEVVETTPRPEATVLTTTSAPVTEAEYNETFVLPECDFYGCVCPPGYSSIKDERNNELCRLDSYYVPNPIPDANDTAITCYVDTDCPPNAVCSINIPEPYSPSADQELGHCVCPQGYEGDGYECIEKTGPNCSCGPSAHCIDTAAGELICVCDAGYHGDGYICRPNFSCTNNSDCEYNAECRPDAVNGEYVCQCIEGYIKDQNDACIPDGQLCNGAVCAEHASCLYDETDAVSYCHCDEGYEGEGISQCTPQGRTCDVYNDCNPNAVCTRGDNSFQCVCRDGFVGDGYTCNEEVNCRTNPYMCDIHASCLKTNDGYECDCNSGYNGNGSYCELNPRLAGNFLVASDGSTIYKVPFRNTPRDFATPLNSAVYQIAVGVDVDCLTGRIYWGDVVSNTIKRVAYDGSGFEQFLPTDVKSPEGLAIDWAARNIFWTDSKKLTIEVANMDTKVRKVLFSGAGIANPRGIAVHPGLGKIFWSDWNRADPKIEWANMDGSQRGVFLDKLNVKLPNSLAIDWTRDRLCYSDAGLFSIRCVTIDTRQSETVASNCSYPFGLAISGDKFYWTDWRTQKIEYIDTVNQVRGLVPISTTSRLFGLAVAPDQCPGATNVCQNRNGNCDVNQLCLPVGYGTRTCVDDDAPMDNYIR
ncbi:nidogen [Epargyreus clarus]|uniref:nidogen n=1 Tax=Epargyreus clarus TaxID=520877 RepID=UPI003C2E37D4